MKNIFKLFQEAKKAPQLEVAPTVSESVEQQIYRDVYSAQELLIKEANEILAKPIGIDEGKYKRLLQLHELGFKNAEEVKAFKEMSDAKKKAEERNKLIDYYSKTYPLQRFIDMEGVERVCEKYNLYLTKASEYIAEIPEKNQKEIISFKVCRKDIREPYETMQFDSFSFRTLGYRSDFTRYMTQEERNTHYSEKIQPQHLLIMAPENKIDMRNKRKVGRILTKDDPIVLQPVHGGYLIVSSWGLEASDSEVVNKINN